MPLRSSKLKEVDSNDPPAATLEGALRDAVRDGLGTSNRPALPLPRACTLGIHDDAFSKLEVLVNEAIFPNGEARPGSRLKIVAQDLDSPRQTFKRRPSDHKSSFNRRNSTRPYEDKRPDISYVFVAAELPPDLLVRYPSLEISVTQRIATALGFKNRSQVTVSQVEEQEHSASHVEIAFRDAYLTRADMWRLVVSELAGKAIYKSQKITFMNTIKAQIRTIYHHGEKKQSAFFGKHTKPVFRSESARYVLFIQMSREMWGFDTDGTGEIMFHKVVNGFLPELFQRWDELGAHHLISIILFTRMEYDQPLVASLEPPKDEFTALHLGYTSEQPHHRDFYRVLVSDMASGQWAAILEQLKHDFKTFLRDVSISTSHSASSIVLGQDSLADTLTAEKEVISGRPTAASRGNILEAINVASSQFSGDYIDRDLVRTGLSVIVVTPGTGVFEVDHNLLSITTDVLIENGVSIDLVCLSRMPLHSVPLIKYKRSSTASQSKHREQLGDQYGKAATLTASYGSVRSYQSSAPSSLEANAGILGQFSVQNMRDSDHWHYAIPHWLDVSFWTPSNTSDYAGGSMPAHANVHAKREFIPRIKMYEVQMMGIMEHDMSNTAIPYLRPPKIDLRSSDFHASDLRSRSSATSLNIAAKKHKYASAESTAGSTAIHSRASSPAPPHSKGLASFFEWMDQYDDAVFRHPRARTRPVRHTSSGVQERFLRNQRSRNEFRKNIPEHRYHETKLREHPDPKNSVVSSKRPSGGSLKLPKTTPAKPKLPRQISLGFRGIGGMIPKATPIAEVSSTNAVYGAYARSGRSGSSKAPSQASTDTFVQAKERDTDKDDSETDSVRTQIEATQPIAIKQPTKDLKEYSDAMSMANLEDHERITMLQDKLPLNKEEISTSVQQGLSPRKAMAPWLTILNPCNPTSNRDDPQKRLGRWHHVFPRPINASHVKWKSMCSPASVPLTTEDFPTLEQLSNEYDEQEYTVKFVEVGNPWEDGTSGKWLPRELLSARFSHGFQVVINDAAVQYFQLAPYEDFTIFDDAKISKAGTQIVLSRGSSIHKLTIVDNGLVEVKILTRRATADPSNPGFEDSLAYRPVVRTTLSDTYEFRELRISSSKEAYDWQRLDQFVGGHESQKNDTYPNLLNFWRARYVLIPVERSSNQRRRMPPTNEDNEEEIRLEGIKKLTQLWQKHRYVASAERPAELSKRKVENNPLDLIYRTMKPSAIVAAEMNVLDTEDEPGKSALPESDLFDKSNYTISSLAQAIQGERGIRITNRRWHWRLHYNCFIGMELVTWLLNNFRDIGNREEAAEFGDELMKQGLFVHVERRHNFRDGNFFFQIANEYLARKEPRSGWFGRSVPSTPMADASRLSTLKSRSGPVAEDETSEVSAPRKQKLGAELSKSLVYNADLRHRSYRPELMVLHYDRISSADDCYHLRIDWMNVTPKLIEDNISNWAALAERNGLRLVELPIAEASKINQFHPFRGPYVIKLAKAPPETQPQTYFDTTSLLPKPASKHFYQEAILRKFNFVLDLEAASDFPATVDVTYSWGRPDYRYPQYISRTGVILAQITDEGHLLLLANRLYNNRIAGIAESQRAQRPTQPEVDHHHSPARQPAAKHFMSPSGSPFPSPIVRAIPDVGPGTAKLDCVTPEKIKDEVESFCTDAGRLERFYEDIMKEAPTPVPATPMLDNGLTGLAAPPAFSLREEASGPSATESDASTHE